MSDRLILAKKKKILALRRECSLYTYGELLSRITVEPKMAYLGVTGSLKGTYTVTLSHG